MIYERATAVWQGPLWMHGGFLFWAVVLVSSLGAVAGARSVEQPVGQGDDEILKLGERERGCCTLCWQF